MQTYCCDCFGSESKSCQNGVVRLHGLLDEIIGSCSIRGS